MELSETNNIKAATANLTAEQALPDLSPLSIAIVETTIVA